MFEGTGDYSAQYGQALSSVLLLNTVDRISDNGLGISGTAFGEAVRQLFDF